MMAVIKHVVASFAEAARNGQVFDRIDARRIRAIDVGNNWDLPAFDFGHLDDLKSPNILPRQRRDELWADWLDLRESGQFRLPFPHCLYVYRWRDGGLVNVFDLRQSDDNLLIDVYFNYAGQPRWHHHAAKLNYDMHAATLDRALTSFAEDFLPAEKLGIYQDAQANWSKMILATLLLRRSNTTEEIQCNDRELRSINSRRAKADESPIRDMIRIRYNKHDLGHRIASAEPTGSTRCPHDRRAHYRRLRSGKIIPVRASHIHGGGDRARNYVVAA
ncbi:hypothetical protein VHN57_02330 [Sphingobium sp. WW5]|jgi:hypothetical protein|uniref:hypothetical protein n=1 Tax=unclassified Sphingobium TaxID=2611147 RepID=UPI003C154D63